MLELGHEYLQAPSISARRPPPDIISYAVWLYYRFNLNHRGIEDLLAERGITVSYETIRLWCIKFGTSYAKRLRRRHGGEPRKIVTDKLRSYGVAHRELIPEAIHVNDRYANNRAEQSHEMTRVRERGMRGPAFRKFKSPRQARRFLGAHAAVSNLFNLGRHLVRAQHYRDLRISAFGEWSRAVA